MRYRKFISGFECSEISLGTLGLSGGYGSIHKEESIRAIREALSLGVNLIDTADVYGYGLGEKLIRKALSSSSDVWIVTKIGRDWYQRNCEKNWDPEYLSFAAHNSLRRLGRPALDVCLLHNPDLKTIQSGEAFSTLEGLKRKGDIRHWGVSVSTADEGIAASHYLDLEVIQFYANIAEPELLYTLLPFLKTSRIGTMVRTPFGGGLLTGKYTEDHEFEASDYRSLKGKDWRKRLIKFVDCELANESIAARIRLALKCVLSNSEVDTLVCGMKNIQQVRSNVAALYR